MGNFRHVMHRCSK